MDSSKINALGWKAKIKLNDGIEDSINDYIERYEKGR
jgi:nucleoside-diphosphate-sugar epimerase